MTPTIYHYPKCSTCRNALKWLDGRGIHHHRVDIVEAPPSARELKRLHRVSGLPLAKFFNTSGESYRAGGFRDRLPGMSEDEAFNALAADGKLIKRPLLDAGNVVMVGFDADTWGSALKPR